MMTWTILLLAIVFVVFIYPQQLRHKHTKKQTISAKKRNWQKGCDFEKYIMKKFPTKFFTIKEVTADKGFDIGVYVEATGNPDLVVEFHWKAKKIQQCFAVECKWRHKTYQDRLLWARPDQITRYQNFAKKRQIPVFIAIGLGGKPQSPEQLFIVPLKDIEKDIGTFRGEPTGMITLSKLQDPKNRYQKDPQRDFFYQPEQKRLS